MINRIQELRKNFTQEEIARKIDISLSQYRNIEKNRSIPSVEIALKIAKVLNTTVEELYILED